jgi:hypothetical protein
MGMSFRSICIIALGALSLALGAGCTQAISSAQLIQHQALIDCSGLGEPQHIDCVKVTAAVPQKWIALVPKRTAVYTDMQWRSPSRQTGVGVAYIHLPLPLPASMIVWMAKQEYAKQGESGQVLGQWADSLGRPWFEAQNSRYHVLGYVLTHGFDAWIVYCGYRRTDEPPSAAELGVASRALERIVPIPIAPDIPTRSMASIGR